MLISTRSRYGLKIMYELAPKYGAQPVFLKEIARAHRMSEKYLSKLVISLRGQGLITSHRGAHGGYTLSRDPGTITAPEIVQALEGDIVPATKHRGPQAAKDVRSAALPRKRMISRSRRLRIICPVEFRCRP